MLTIDPSKEITPVIQNFLLSTVTPRPVAFVSTVDDKGNPNLSPFSFFNAFSANPPILVFSPATRVRDNTKKNTLENVQQIKEVVICVVNYEMAQQMSLASADYPKGVSEFEKAGFTPVISDKVAPYRVKESPVNFECRVNEVIELGKEGGAGNLVLCEVVAIHIDEKILDENGNIDALKLGVVSRHGGNLYGKTIPESLFEMEKPIYTRGIGIDQLPESIRNSKILTGSHLAQLANVKVIPGTSVDINKKYPDLNYLPRENTHELASKALDNGDVGEAWQILIN